MKNKVLIVDDHPLTRAGIRTIIETDSSFTIIGEAEDGEQALTKVNKLQPDIVVMDITMPNLSGIEATQQLVATSPDIKIIALSIHSGEHFVKEMLNAGAVGYLLKEEAPEELLRALNRVSKGDMFLSSGVTRVALNAEENHEEDFELNILQTKLHRPPIMDDYIIRQQLVDQLENSILKPLSIISAGAGYGKSTTVSQWLEQSRFVNSWLSLDDDHNDLRTFLFYLCAAIEKTFPDSLENTKNLFSGGKLPPVKVIATTLINEIFDIKQDFILVLDDYHVIREKKIHQLLDEWLRFPPTNVHLTIITRRDPPLNIATLSNSGRITHIRMDDLSLANDEISSLFNKLLGIELNDQNIERLQDKTEGWIIGLRLISMMLKDQQNVDAILQELEGSLNSISDYLISEVLSIQPKNVQTLLMESSILNSFSAELIDAVRGTKDKGESNSVSGAELIQLMIQSNMFLIALDTEQLWYRYNHLFQQVLRTQLLQQRTTKEINKIHLKASQWFETNNYFDTAIAHAIEGGDSKRALRIIIENWEEFIEEGDWLSVEKWLTNIPKEKITKLPSLLFIRLWIIVERHRIEEIPALVAMIEENVGSFNDTEAGYLAFAKCLISYFKGEAQAALGYAEQALKLIPKKHIVFRAHTYAWWTVSMQALGQGEDAIQDARNALKNIDFPGKFIQLVQYTLHPNFVFHMGADLPSLRLGIEEFFNIPNIHYYKRGMGWYFLGSISWWSFDLEGTIRDFKYLSGHRYQIRPRLSVEAYICTALALQGLNRPDEARQVMEQGLKFDKETNNPTISSVMASGMVRLNLAQGKMKNTKGWLNATKDAKFDASMLWWVEVPAITRCRALIALGTPQKLGEALELLQRYKDYAESIFNKLRIIEIVVLQAQAHLKSGQNSEAKAALKHGLELAAPGEFIRPFIEFGEKGADLLKELKEENITPAFIEDILSEVKRQQETVSISSVPPTESKEQKANPNVFTRRELEILQCVAEGLRNQEIADRLFNSEETIKKHVYNMFKKADVKNRMRLVDKAIEMGWLKKQTD